MNVTRVASVEGLLQFYFGHPYRSGAILMTLWIIGIGAWVWGNVDLALAAFVIAGIFSTPAMFAVGKCCQEFFGIFPFGSQGGGRRK